MDNLLTIIYYNEIMIVCKSIYIHFSVLLHLMNINCVNRSSVNLQRSGVKTLPAILNNLSTAAEDAGTPKTFLAIVARAGYLSL